MRAQSQLPRMDFSLFHHLRRLKKQFLKNIRPWTSMYETVYWSHLLFDHQNRNGDGIQSTGEVILELREKKVTTVG